MNDYDTDAFRLCRSIGKKTIGVVFVRITDNVDAWARDMLQRHQCSDERLRVMRTVDRMDHNLTSLMKRGINGTIHGGGSRRKRR